MEVDEEFTLSQTQTLSQAQRNLEQHSPSEVEQKVRHFLCIFEGFLLWLAITKDACSVLK